MSVVVRTLCLDVAGTLYGDAMSTVRFFDSLAADLGSALFPAACPGCGRRGEPVCGGCVHGMRPAVAAPPPVGIGAWAAPYAYEGIARELVARTKYRNERHAIRWLSNRAAAHVNSQHPELAHAIANGSAVLAWVATTERRRRARGFDHAELIAKALGSNFGVSPVALLGRLDDVAQTGQARERRLQGPQFTARVAKPATVSKVPQPDVEVVLCDDVATTGSTLRNAALALRHAGWTNKISAITLARTPPR